MTCMDSYALLNERAPRPSATIFDGRTLQSSPEGGARAGYDGYKRKNGRKVHIAVDTLRNVLTSLILPTNERDTYISYKHSRSLLTMQICLGRIKIDHHGQRRNHSHFHSHL